MVDYRVRLTDEESENLRRVAEEDARTFNAIFKIGLRLYLTSRNNFMVTGSETIRVPPQG